MRVADYIIERLYEEQVKHIFMVTGRGILNPFQRFGRGHTTTASPEHKEKLDKLNLQLKRG